MEHSLHKLFNYELLSLWGQYIENLYDIVSIIHQVLPKHVYFAQN
jgi:hypothetical protein